METLYFVLGLLTIISTALVVGIVLSVLKINKLNGQLTNLETVVERDMSTIYRNMQSEHEDVWRHFEATGRDITMVERTIMERIDKELTEAHRRLDKEVDEIQSSFHEIQRHELELEQAIHRDIDDTRKYIDSRIDKVVLAGVLKEPKRQING